MPRGRRLRSDLVDSIRAPQRASSAQHLKLRPSHLLLLLLLGLPVGVWAAFTGRSTLAFLASAASLVPLAYVIGLSTEAVAVRLGPSLGSVVLAALSNSVELILGLLALQKGLTALVQAAITGSILANVLFVLGSAMFVGGLRHRAQSFGGKSVNVQATVLLLAALALFLPSLTKILVEEPVDFNRMSLWLAGGLLVTYVLGLIFTLGTHRHLFDLATSDPWTASALPRWSLRKSILLLTGASLLATASAEVLTRSVAEAAQSLGWSELFVGAIVLAFVANAAEHASAVTLAWKNRLHASLQIATASSIQIALFVAPILIFASQGFDRPLSLVFSLFEVVAIGASVIVLNFVAYDGESNWFEGALLVMIYLVIGAAFFFQP